MNTTVPPEALHVARSLRRTVFSWSLYLEGSYAKHRQDVYSDIDLGLIVDEAQFRAAWKYIPIILQARMKRYFCVTLPPSKEYPMFAGMFLIHPTNPFRIIDISVRTSTQGWRGSSIRIEHHEGVDQNDSPTYRGAQLHRRQFQSVTALVMLLKIRKALARKQNKKQLTLIAERIIQIYLAPFIRKSDNTILQLLVEEQMWEEFVRVAVDMWKRKEVVLHDARWLNVRRSILRALK